MAIRKSKRVSPVTLPSLFPLDPSPQINSYCSHGHNVNHSCRQCLQRTLERWGIDAEAYDRQAILERSKRTAKEQRQRFYVKGDPDNADRHREKTYGLTPQQYHSMRTTQGGVCALCKMPEMGRIKGTLRALAVDHDHTTGMVRKLLCGRCNKALGQIEGLGPQWLHKAVRYLVLHKALHWGEEAQARSQMLSMIEELRQIGQEGLRDASSGTSASQVTIALAEYDPAEAFLPELVRKRRLVV